MTLEEQAQDYLNGWVQNQNWTAEDSFRSIIPETNHHSDLNDWVMDWDIVELNEEYECEYSFTIVLFFSGEQYKDDNITGLITGDLSYDGEEFTVDSHAFSACINGYYGDELEDLEEEQVTADDIICELSKLQRGLWFRGQSDASWDLETSIARRDSPSLSKERELKREFERRVAFLDNAKYPLPLEDLYFLMQHHGIPTRLLDWTTSPLVALYFALSDKDQDNLNACIWVMDPSQLNRSFGEDYPAELTDHLLTESENKIVAICAAHTNTRMTSQKAEFTVHMTYKPINTVKECKIALREAVVIPSHLKNELREKLRNLGIDRGRLFPDLDNIARTVVEDVLGDITSMD